MNRKKIALLLTGLVVTSGILTSCGSNNQTSQDNSKVAKQSSVKRVSERTVNEYKGEEYPNVAYGENIVPLEDMNLFSGKTTIEDTSLSKNYSVENITGENTQISDESLNFENSIARPYIGGLGNIPTNDIALNPENIVSFEENQDLQNSMISTENIGMPSTKADTKNEAGTINVLKAVGGSLAPSEAEFIAGAGTDKQERRIQGTALVSFKLSGEVLDLGGLRSIMQAAYEEARLDANQQYQGKDLTKRLELAKLLEKIFTPSKGLELFFQGPEGLKAIKLYPKVMFMSYSSDISKADKQRVDLVRRIIDLDYTDNTFKVNEKGDRRAEDIVLKMQIASSASFGERALLTNTPYKFLGTNGAKNLMVETDSTTLNGSTGTSTPKELLHFSIPDFTTSKQSAKIEVSTGKTGNASVLYDSSRTDYGTSGTGEQKAIKFNFFDYLTDTTYINLKKLVEGDSPSLDPDAPVIISPALDITGTSIKFKTLVLNDIDKTITQVQFEDDRNNKYNTQLVPVDSKDKTKGSNVEVIGLNRNTKYVFTRMIITSNINGKTEVKSIPFKEFVQAQPGVGAGTSSEIAQNKLAIQTAQFVGPKMSIVDPQGNETLPGPINVPKVKNDSTALRYIIKVNNSEGLIGDMKVIGLRNNEKSKVEKIIDKDNKTNYYVVTLYDLMPNFDYGVVVLELQYEDPYGNKSETRQSLNEINPKDKTTNTPLFDNVTEKNPLTGTERFNVLINDKIKSENPREVEVPVFIDDMQGSFVRVDFVSPKESSTVVNLKYEDNKLKFSNLKPASNLVFKVDFIYKDENGQEKSLPKYVEVVTPDPLDMDIKSSNVTINGTEAEVKFELYSQAKSEVKKVVVKDESGKELKSTWSKDNKILKIQELKSDTNYKNVTVTFTLENNKTITYTIPEFSTKPEIIKPTGKVDEFVERVYKIALGREPEVEGWNFWIDKLQKKEITATEFIAENLMTQKEFIERELDKKSFVTTMYSLIVNREPDSEGQKYWERKYDEYKPQTNSIAELRIKIAREMMDQPEFKELVTNLKLKY